jgi:predicted AlkP superfamily phosphohydrolase/phosphomutase
MKKSFAWVTCVALAGGSLAALAGAAQEKREPAAPQKKVIVLGMDGMDPRLLRRYMSEGKLPNFAALAAQGGLRELATSNPPQSPVAWSTLMTGLDPGGHGIFDFIHRDPATLLPFLSTTSDDDGDSVVAPGSRPYPLGAGDTRQLRDGRAFWEYLDEAGIPVTIFRIPSNWPPAGTAARTFSGMGTPDLLGTYGTFSFYTDDLLYTPGPVDGGRIHAVEVTDDVVRAKLYGPYNPYVKGRPQATLDFKIRIDREAPGVTVTLPGQEFKLREGQWSDWVGVEFRLAPGPVVRGICRFYLKQAHPRLELYVSPINIDPAAPALPLSTPREYAPELAARAGRFHTLGIAEDTKALSAGIFSDAEYLTQARAVLAEQRRLFDLEFARFSEGLFFFYFSSADQNAHMLWRLTDPKHPAYDEQLARAHGAALGSFYVEMDAVLGQVMKRLDDRTTLIVLSDHGFAPFYRQFNLNTWLAENGYLVRKESAAAGGAMLEGVDWSRTRAYGLGLNALYVNLQGRERDGIVAPQEAAALKEEIAAKLLAYRDPQTGAAAVTRVADASEIYHGAHAADAPDLLVGYGWGYRIGWGSVLGGIPAQVVEDNLELWSGDHAMDPALVPGILLSNRKIAAESPSLLDIAPTLLAEFGIAVPAAMHGQPVFAMPQPSPQAHPPTGLRSREGDRRCDPPSSLTLLYCRVPWSGPKRSFQGRAVQ